MREKKPLSVMDCNNFWSPSGGGVRRYHLEKLARFQAWDDVHYVFVMPDNHRRSERLNETTFIEHIPGFKFPGNWEYRFILDKAGLRALIEKHKPDIIEIGSPYIMPFMVRWALAGLPFKPRLVGFWHADFPATYVGRFFRKFGKVIGSAAESLAWWYARLHFNKMDATLVASREIMRRMEKRGLQRLRFLPLGVDTVTFHPDRRDAALAASLKSGLPDRLTIFFGHRFCEEKGLRTLLQAYPDLCQRLGHEPAIVFAGTGPDLAMVEQAVATYAHIRYVGFIRDPSEMARHYASCDMGLMLSGWETFGLAMLEAMACGQLLVAADQGATKEHVETSGAGQTFRLGEAASLVDAMEALYRAPDPQAMRLKGCQYAEGLTWDACFARELACYRELAGESGEKSVSEWTGDLPGGPR